MIKFMEMIRWILRVSRPASGNRKSISPVQDVMHNPESKTGQKPKGTDILFLMEDYLLKKYDFRINSVSETTEYKRKGETDTQYITVGNRQLNSLCIETRKSGIDCWDRDISRFINSADISSYHPMQEYVRRLRAWDGTDRVTAIARRISGETVWINGFHTWLLGVTAQWSGNDLLHANSVAPVLVSQRQGMHKSTFCKMLLPTALQAYYTDSFDLSSVSGAEQKLAAFGLINLDEMDKFSDKKMALLKNLMQMAGMNIRKAYRKNYSPLPRIASFIATSNQRELLTDPTGSRRFLCVEISQKIDCSPFDHDQLYAQLKAELEGGRRHWFTEEEEAAVMDNNQPFQKRGPEEDLFFNCFRHPQEGEEGQLFSAAYIYNELKRLYPSSMREVKAAGFSKSLTALGIRRVHTRYGNRYRVVPTSGA